MNDIKFELLYGPSRTDLGDQNCILFFKNVMPHNHPLFTHLTTVDTDRTAVENTLNHFQESLPRIVFEIESTIELILPRSFFGEIWGNNIGKTSKDVTDLLASQTVSSGKAFARVVERDYPEVIAMRKQRNLPSILDQITYGQLDVYLFYKIFSHGAITCIAVDLNKLFSDLELPKTDCTSIRH